MRIIWLAVQAIGGYWRVQHAAYRRQRAIHRLVEKELHNLPPPSSDWPYLNKGEPPTVVSTKVLTIPVWVFTLMIILFHGAYEMTQNRLWLGGAYFFSLLAFGWVSWLQLRDDRLYLP